MSSSQQTSSALEAIKRKSDQSCSIQSILRDKNARNAKILDYLLIISSTYLLGVTFIQPVTGAPFSFGWEPTKLVAIVSLITFFLTIVQFKSDWKNKAEAHARSCDEYAKVKSDCIFLLSSTTPVDLSSVERVRDAYDSITKIGTNIPDSFFIYGKKKHLKKVFISRYLDDHPGASILIIKIKLFLRDNLNLDLFD